MKPIDTPHVMMSEALKGQIPIIDDENALFEQAQEKLVIVVAEKLSSNKSTAVVGALRGLLLGADPEIEFRCELGEALSIIEEQSLVFNNFELRHGERKIKLPGPFVIKAARIDEISALDQMCTLGLHLSRRQR